MKWTDTLYGRRPYCGLLRSAERSDRRPTEYTAAAERTAAPSATRVRRLAAVLTGQVVGEFPRLQLAYIAVATLRLHPHSPLQATG